MFYYNNYAEGFVVTNCTAKGNRYDFDGTTVVRYYHTRKLITPIIKMLSLYKYYKNED